MDTQKYNKTLGWVVFFLAIIAYLPLGLGAWYSPKDFNMPSFMIWIVLAVQFMYSSRAAGFEGWRMPLGYLVGNSVIVVVMYNHGGYTMNLNSTELILMSGTILVAIVWLVHYSQTKTSNPRIIYFGNILVDIFSFYPQTKQLIEPHPPISNVTIIGWTLFLVTALVNVCLVERLFQKILQKEKSVFLAIEESLFSLEQSLLIGIMVILMIIGKRPRICGALVVFDFIKNSI